jgi:hypothetical protein
VEEQNANGRRHGALQIDIFFRADSMGDLFNRGISVLLTRLDAKDEQKPMEFPTLAPPHRHFCTTFFNRFGIATDYELRGEATSRTDGPQAGMALCYLATHCNPRLEPSSEKEWERRDAAVKEGPSEKRLHLLVEQFLVRVVP